ncbi:MAG: 50S ribosomal protein L9 [Planctomycetota bacterium]|nr:MAG: 50S ribosomal protein L9 [Planctomycetota bacterium]
MTKGNKLVQVLLMQDVDGLGHTGELVDVSPGHARNFLLPMGKAARPSAENLRLLEQNKAKYEAQIKERKSKLEELAKAIPETNVTIEMKVNADGTLYGAVNEKMISQAMQNAGLDIHPQNVRLEQPIKEHGQFDVPIHVYDEVIVEARIWVVQAAS